MEVESHGFSINAARSAEDLQSVKDMFNAYVTSLGIDLTFQSFEAEMKAMPGKYAPPTGELLLARRTETRQVVGCVGLRPLEADGVCEMKRLYVTQAGRKLGIGKALVDAVVQVACKQGHREMRLDTLPSMKPAQRLYEHKGFIEIEPYYETPLEGTKFMALTLSN